MVNVMAEASNVIGIATATAPQRPLYMEICIDRSIKYKTPQISCSCSGCDDVYNSTAGIHLTDRYQWIIHRQEVAMASYPGLHIPKMTTIDLVGGIYCGICHLTFKNKKEYDTHYSQHDVAQDQIVYTCVQCHKDIAGYPSFRGHCYTNHVIKDRFKCEHCHKLFSKVSALNDHVIALHKFTCSTCNREFPSKKELQLHKIIHMNDKPPFNCQSCNEKVDCVDACEVHIDQHSVPHYTCPICSQKLDSKTEAINHLGTHFGDVLNNSIDDDSDNDNDKPEDSSIDLLGGILCTLCQEIYKNRAEIDLHFSQEHPEMSVAYGCNICMKNFSKYYQFGQHCYEHFNKNRFKCESCDKTFSRLARLVTHTEALHSGRGGGRLRCPRCSQHFASEFRFREHQRVEHDICVVMCHQPHCAQIFDTPKELVLHQKQHAPSGERWCRQCGLQLPSRGAAERHLDVHRKKTFACPVCARKYGEKYLLMKHVPQHFETVIHMCKVCGKLYNAKHRLMAHAKIHANVKTHTCSFCAKGFISVYKLKQHQNMHTGLRPYRCVACTKDFNNYSNWSKHLQKIHKIDPKTIKKPKLDDRNDNVEKENVFTEERSENLIDANDTIEMDTLSVMPDNIDISTGLVKKLEGEGVKSEMQETYVFLEPADEVVDLDSINPSIAPGTVADFAVLPPAATFVPDPEPHSLETLGMPREYGPDFTVTDCAGLLHLDDHMLPHIDPLLTINHHQDKWEPLIITKYQGYYGDTNRLAVMNTDIF